MQLEKGDIQEKLVRPGLQEREELLGLQEKKALLASEGQRVILEQRANKVQEVKEVERVIVVTLENEEKLVRQAQPEKQE